MFQFYTLNSSGFGFKPKQEQELNASLRLFFFLLLLYIFDIHSCRTGKNFKYKKKKKLFNAVMKFPQFFFIFYSSTFYYFDDLLLYDDKCRVKKKSRWENNILFSWIFHIHKKNMNKFSFKWKLSYYLMENRKLVQIWYNQKNRCKKHLR